MKYSVAKIHPKDNVLVALTDLQAGSSVEFQGEKFKLHDAVQAKHKFSTRHFEPGDEIIMYGVLVGKATREIPLGGVIGTHNVVHQSSEFHSKSKKAEWTPPSVEKWRDKHFMGFHRDDGQVGTANFWLVIPLVFCENRNVQVIRDAFEEELGFSPPQPYKRLVRELVKQWGENEGKLTRTLSLETLETPREKIFSNIDGIRFLTHEGGCGGTKQDAEALCSLLAGYIHNPNVAGATVLSLGCQHAQADILREKLYQFNPRFRKPLIILEQQKEGTEKKLLTRAIHETFMALAEANKHERKPAPLSKLVVGLECGGSDGFSGISANPAIGHTSDLITALGGATILSEFPELCGVEQELINRCVSEKESNRFIELMRLYSRAAEAVGSGFDMNPSPGNIKDGLITDAIKSAGAAKKGGTSPVTDVLDYGEYVTKGGLNLLCTPGNDVESTTAMAGSGANIILFTTGLGTPTGNPITPVIKVASNSKLAERMPDIIDVDSGSVITGDKTIEEVGEEIFDYIIEVASGNQKPKAVQLNQNDFIPWKRGVSL